MGDVVEHKKLKLMGFKTKPMGWNVSRHLLMVCKHLVSFNYADDFQRGKGVKVFTCK